MTQVLVLDKTWTPLEWIDTDEAITRQAKGLVIDILGDELIHYRGGENSITHKQSELFTGSIIVVNGLAKIRRTGHGLNNQALFQRDRYMCAYCGGVFKHADLTRDHVMPVSQGGPDTWNNVVTACKKCNNIKDDLLPGDKLGHGMPGPQGTGYMAPLYLPYVPCQAEAIIMKGKNILADQMRFLLERITHKERSRIYRDYAPSLGLQ
jgi:hypothetical protein